MRTMLAFLLLSLPAWGQFGMAVPLRTNQGVCNVITAPGAPTFVQYNATYTGSFDNTVTITGVAAGDTLVTTVGIETSSVHYPVINSTITSSGDTWVPFALNGTATPFPTWVWIASNVAAGTHVITVGGGVQGWTTGPMVMEFSGAATSSPLDGTPAQNSSGTLAWPINTGTVTTTQADDAIITLFSVSYGLAGPPSPAVCTYDNFGAGGAVVFGAYNQEPVAGTFSAGWNGDPGYVGSRNYSTIIFALKP